MPEVIDRGNGRADLVYTITEGAKTPVRKISFAGNQAFGARQLNAVIKTSERSVISMLTGGDVYDPDRIAQDRERLRTYYRSKGYADANVRSADAEYDPATKGFAVTFVIDEGPLYRFGNVGVACNVPGLDSGETVAHRSRPRRRNVRRQRPRQDHRSPGDRDGETRLSPSQTQRLGSSATRPREASMFPS